MKIEEETNKNVTALKHPNRLTASGKIIDGYLKKQIELCNEAITLCLTSNLWETSKDIYGLLGKGDIVLVDRYIHTNLAYSQMRGISLKKLENTIDGIINPDLVIYLRTESGNVSDRDNFGAERYETIEIQLQVQRNFDEIFKKDPKIMTIDSCKSIEEVSKEIWENVQRLL